MCSAWAVSAAIASVWKSLEEKSHPEAFSAELLAWVGSCGLRNRNRNTALLISSVVHPEQAFISTLPEERGRNKRAVGTHLAFIFARAVEWVGLHSPERGFLGLRERERGEIIGTLGTGQKLAKVKNP